MSDSIDTVRKLENYDASSEIPGLDFVQDTLADPTILYNRLVSMGIARKLVNIAVAEMRVPHDLVRDAGQEIRMAWLKSKTKPEFSFGEVASYGHRIARHACLRARRDLGSPVRLPGSAFRRRKDGTSSITPGLLAKPLDWNDIEERVRLDEDCPDDMAADAVPDMHTEEQEPWQNITPERIAELKGALSPRQWVLLEALLAGKSLSLVSQELDIKQNTLTRQLSSIRARLQDHGLI